MNISRTMVFNDIHIPFHDTRLITLDGRGMLLDILEDSKCNRLVINGDLGDLYNWNSYGIHPDVQIDMKDELYLLRIFLKNLRKRFPELIIDYCLGNHEMRFEKWLIEKAKPMHNMLRLEDELSLEEYEINWFPYQHKYRLEETNVYIMHSPPSYGVNGARTSLLKKNDETYIYGCSHREDQAHVTGGSGKRYAAYFNGWGGSIDETPAHEKVFSYRKGHFGWQKCFIIATVIDGKEAHINQYSIRNHKTCVDGHIYDYSNEPLSDDLNYYEE